jgi:vacuolar protein sorting-associated protein 13A/C
LLENLRLKNTIFDNIKLPLKLKFGKIKKLSISMPWTRIKSAPVEVILETLMIVVVPTHSDDWKIIDSWSFDHKKKILDEFVQALEQNLKLQFTQKEELKEEGFFDKLITKILDNLQLTIKNIHIRYEDRLSTGKDQPFSLGVTLKELSASTTNGEWVPQYFDRNVADNKDKPIYKHLKIDNFAIYLHCGDYFLLTDESSKPLD